MSGNSWPLYIQKRYALDRAKMKDPSKVTSPPLTSADEVDAKLAVDWVYSVLTTLDSKASALMRLNGVLIAAAAFLLGLFRRQGGSILSTDRLDATVIICLAVLSAFSIFLCLFVVRVSWPFLGKVTVNDGGTFDFTREIAALVDTSERRQKTYMRAWRVTFFASLGFLAEFAVQGWHVLSLSNLD